MKKYRQFLVGFLCASLLFGSVSYAAARYETVNVTYREGLKITVNDQQVKFDEEPMIVDPGWIMCQIEPVVKAMGATVNWEDSISTLHITGNDKYPFTLGSTDSYVENVSGLMNRLETVSKLAKSRVALFEGSSTAINNQDDVDSFLSILTDLDNIADSIIIVKPPEMYYMSHAYLVKAMLEVQLGVAAAKTAVHGKDTSFLEYTTTHLNEVEKWLVKRSEELGVAGISPTSNIKPSSSSSTKLTASSDASEIAQFLNQNYGSVETALGKLTLQYDVMMNDRNYFPWDYWITMNYGASTLFSNLAYKVGINKADHDSAIKSLREHAQKVYEIVHVTKPSKKIMGSYHDSWYAYPNLKLDLKTRNYLSWANYIEGDILAPGVAYEKTTLTQFHWTPDMDDFKF